MIYIQTLLVVIKMFSSFINFDRNIFGFHEIDIYTFNVYVLESLNSLLTVFKIDVSF